MGKYLPVEEKNLPMFKTAEELIKQGYEEMRELVGITLASEGSKRLDLNLPI
ncbi:MAG: hypothetical protein STSR0004_17330 [Peptococcaceae bacterium]